MKKKVIGILIILGIITGIIFSIATYAGTGKLYTNLESLDLDGVGYGIGDPTNKGKYIWNMNTYDSTSGGLSEEQKNIYCLRAEYGESWESFYDSSPILEYNMFFDLQQEREELLNKIVDNENDADEIVQNLLDVNGSQYREILWLLDNMYIKGENNKEDYLAKVGIVKDEYEGVVEYYNSNTGIIYGEELLTDADIIAIQRVAIWTITNGGDYDKTENANWLRITTDGSNYKLLSDSREAMAVDLYKYLISSAKTGASLYTAENNYTINDAPVEVNVNGLTVEDGKYKINAKTSDSNYIIGPIIVDKNNDFLYKISMIVTDENDVEIGSSKYSFTDSNGNSLGNVTLKDLVGKTDGFYIKVDRSIATKVNVQIQVAHYNTTKNLWLQGTETTDEVKLNAEQPIAEFSKEEVTTTMEFIAEPELIEVSVEKVWDDSDNQDGIRPSSIGINLKNGNTTVKTVTLNESNNWIHTFTDLPKKENGTEINYTVEENVVLDKYTSEITGNMGAGYTITNTHKPEVTEISVVKVWDDNENQDGLKPDSISVSLLANGTAVAGKTLELSDQNQWKGTFIDLPAYSSGTPITYTVTETTQLEGYDAPVITGDANTGFTITNTHTPEVISVAVTKVWDDGEDQDGIRPDSVIVKLKNGNTTVGTVALSKSNNWTHIFDNLPKNEDGIAINYTVEEGGVPANYASETTGDMATGYTITNTYIPEVTQVSVEKVWNDNDNQDGKRPNTISVTLLANGVGVKTETLTGEGNEWTHTFTELPKYESGEEIEYTVVESGVPEGYSSLTAGNPTNGFTITNTYTSGTTSVKVIKVWDDNDNQDGLRADSVTVSLLGNGEIVQTIELNASNDWQHVFTGLQEKENGEYITYTISEITQIEGYTTTIKNNNVTSTFDEIETSLAPEYIITNTHETDEISITVTKVWEDENNYDKIRPTSVVVNIKNGNTIVDTVTLSDDNNWIYTFENLPANENGETINYVIEEVEPNGYTANITPDENEKNKYIITNTHIPEKSFDLALRKYITKINNNELTTLGLETRVPQIATDTIETKKTATYRHRKAPVEVEENDIITYAITIYNEGEKLGYASQIIDQLPEGLIYNPSATITSKDANGTEKNTYKVTYESSTNKVIFDIVNTTENPAEELQTYEEGDLDSETIEIKCKVVHRAKAGKSNILTNVAWINEAYDAEESKTITITVGDDRDSEPGTKPNVNKDNMEDYKGNDDNKDDLTDSTYYYEGEQDDDDFEKIYVKTFDLSLRKFVASVNGKELENSREPDVNVAPLQNGTGKTAIYSHPKTPVALKAGDTVVYTIRVYNEGEIDGFANEVKDYLPPYLEYVKNSVINSRYGWNISEDGRIAITAYLANKEISAFNGTTLDYEDIQIECKVSENAVPDERITNIAEISEYKYGDTVYPEDGDSKSDNIEENLPEDKDLPDYQKTQERDSYVPGNEDDDDFEKIYVKEFDLSLRKFITQVQDREITSRIPQVKNENGVISYEHSKDALTVHVGEIVIYTLRIYNEGEISGYASEITDDIPEYLEYLPEDSTNVEYMWKMYDENGNETEIAEEAVKVKTTYLSKENGKNNLLAAFDGNTIYYRDVKIAFKVKDPSSNTYIITNHAQISNDTDEDGNKIKDKDSYTDKWNDGEDDQDIENIKVEYFDLSILKFVSKVIIQENGTEKITETGYNGHENPEPVVKVELHKKKLNDVVVKFGYGITVTNEGDVPGYATEVTDYVPEGLKFSATDNPKWTDEGNNAISTKQLENTLLQPGESKTIEVILTWVNAPDNMALKTNTVEISKDKNEYDVPDRDSTPNNKQENEDDMDIAKVILAIATGSTKTYFMLTLGLLSVIATGVFLIKKFVI